MQTIEERAEHLSQFGVVNQVRSVSVDESTQSQAVLPAGPQNKGKHQRDGGRKVVEEERGVRRLQLWKGGDCKSFEKLRKKKKKDVLGK